jgi:4-amino-4-deoxy-L-arabinose transferase-like glycosyltransferase
MTLLSADKPVPFWFILVFAGIVWGGQYVVRDLWEPDEARYTYVAREMDQSGSWLVPMRSGETYAHKPPLMFWLIKAGTVLTGGEYNGVSGRFPTFLGVLLCLWMVSRMSLMWFDPQTAWRTFFILSTSSLFWQKAGTGQIDMLLLGLEMSALYFLFTQDKSPSNWRLMAAFCFMGLAILAKGPVGLMVPVGIYITATIFSGQAKKLKKTYWLWGIPLSLAWPAAWLIGAKLSGAPQHYLNELLFSQNVGRLTGEFGGHAKPFYYYLQYLIADFMPWIFFVPVSIRILKNDVDSLGQLKRLAGWMLFVVVFFSLCASKRNLYILSVYPAASMMVAAAWPQLLRQSKNWINASAYPILVVMFLVALAGVAVPMFVDLPFSSHVLLPVSLALGVGSFFLIQRREYFGLDQAWFKIFVAAFILTELCVSMIVFPALNPIKTPQVLAQAAKAYLNPTQELLLFRINGEIFAFYSDRKGRRLDSLADLGREMARQGKGIVVFEKKDRKIFEEHYKTAGPLQAFKMGGKEIGFLKFDMTNFNKGFGQGKQTGATSGESE